MNKTNSIKLLGIIEEDFVNYKKVSMTLEFPYCDFKCDKDAGQVVCQNISLRSEIPQEYLIQDIITSYVNNDISESIVMQGFEPFDSYAELFSFIYEFRKFSKDDIVIYTGYNKDEINDKVDDLTQFNNIIIKFGRFIPNSEHRKDDILGIELASNNQYAVKIS